MQKTLEDRYFDMLRAIRKDDKQLLAESVKNGANPMQLNNRNQNSLHYIAEFGTQDAAKTFMEYLSEGKLLEESLLQKDKYGMTPLMLAAQKGNEDVVALFAKDTIDKESLSFESFKTALMFAVESGSLKSVETLLDAGADVNAVSERTQQNVLMHAIPFFHDKIANLLISRGANINHRDRFEKTALMIACDNDADAIINLLMDQPNIDALALDDECRDAFWYCKARNAYPKTRDRLKNLIAEQRQERPDAPLPISGHKAGSGQNSWITQVFNQRRIREG